VTEAIQFVFHLTGVLRMSRVLTKSPKLIREQIYRANPYDASVELFTITKIQYKIKSSFGENNKQ